ncbi:hypothetical protein H1Z61_14355 [Bacillus aquiflavi]|uniref:Uncharacterized protein n=1 Tax=Bacillus aquiflavi TaxID=2672567 RepID=A0A6B3W593_9BACI|nr:hypothetical protein [Bacillus aquiflavi]MBA4538285.1 hypothetical protein [Bacillus aquiflavi]NEY82604.1 hypothetical protein [Bacillus aquiflavi]UAC48138.1 hypothetical protein K6959_16455 [Bacillus aquiflavi]
MMKTKLTVVSKNAKNKKEITIIVDNENKTAFNETTQKEIKLDSIRKNYEIIAEEPVIEENAVETIEETTPEQNTDDTNEVKNDDEVKHVENEKSNADETNNEEQNEAEAEMEPFPFDNVTVEDDVHKKHGEIKIVSFTYNGYSVSLHFFADKNNCLKLIKRGAKVWVTGEKKMAVNTTSMKKALTEIGILDEDMQRAKQTILEIKKAG